MSETKNFIKRLLYDLTIFGMILSLVLRFGVSVSNVSSGSMEGSVLTGDKVILLPWVYGGKTPQTPLAIPFVQQPTVFGFSTYLPWIQLPVARAPGFKPKKGEVVTFYPTINTDDISPQAQKKDKKQPISRHPADTKIPFLKRIVATAGDKLNIKDGQVLVNGAMQDPNAKYRQYCYIVKLSDALNTHWLEKNTKAWNSSLASEGMHQYNLTMTLAQKANLEKYLSAKSIKLHSIALKPSERKATEGDAGLSNEMEEVTVPYHRWDAKKKKWKSLTIYLNQDTPPVYIATLENTDPNFQKEEKGGETRFYLNGKQIYEYTFKENFFFPIGDNFHSSMDGRSFGFVPYKHLNAKAYRVLFNYTSWSEGKGWRFLHKIPAGADTNESGLLLFSVFLLVLFALIGGIWLISRKKE
ncbi:MAG: S26 family signal peptidase [Bacteroidota bacterium]